MTNFIIPTVAVVLIAVICVLYLCRKRYILDGDGMINPKSWDSFTVSRSDSYGVEMLDAPTVKIEVFCTDGRILEKADVDSFSISVYQIVVGSFKKKRSSSSDRR